MVPLSRVDALSPLRVILSAIAGNVGAGIAVVGASGRATVIDSAVSQQLGGPGLYLGEGATLTLARSTVSGNTRAGIFAEPKSTLLLAESLVSRTRSVAGAPDGHGIYAAGTLRLTKSAVLDNGAAGVFLDGVTVPASIAESLVAKSEWTPDRALGYGVALRGSAVQISRSELRDKPGRGAALRFFGLTRASPTARAPLDRPTVGE